MILELVCLAIVAVYVVVRAKLDAAPRRFLGQLALIALASFAAEDSVIHAYGFYAYAPSWSVFFDRVPVMIILIWPVVIHSAWDLARRILDGRPGVPLLGAAIVLFDASLIEPVAVRAGLWAWTEPGLFAVPPVGVLGWAFFAGLVIFALERGAPLLLAAAVPATHVLLLATWWGALRWVNGPIAETPALIVVWALSAAIAAHAWRSRLRERVPLVEMLLRVPGAVFFFALLAVAGADLELVLYAVAFAPPYLAITRLRDQRLIMQVPATQTEGAQQSRSLAHGPQTPDV